ncbi:MAG: ABC transporter permease subunit [Deltaproteobacteria bacterium]|nr:ABC transporter permease subunit [Deltaproteobacteria bacterium]
METIYLGLIQSVHLLLSGDPELYGIIVRSLLVSGTAVLLAALCGISGGIGVALHAFPGRRLLINILNTLMGLPPVVVGLVVYVILSRSGPLGALGLLFTPTAMVIAQTILATPILAALTVSALLAVKPQVRDTAMSLGATPRQAAWTVVREARFGLMAAVIAGFGRVSAEVGAVMMVGGNIAGYTRVMTTAIVLDTAKGEFAQAIALGIVLIMVAFLVNLGLNLFQGRGAV